MSTPQHATKRLLFAVVTCLALLSIVEVALWAAGVATVLEDEDPFRGFSGLVDVFERDGERYRTRPGSLGTFNDQSFLVDKPEAGFRIFTLGGSSAHGFPWGAEAAFTAILGEALAEHHTERSIEAVNVGGVSYAMHRLTIVAEELLAYDPDVFIIYGGHNEFIEPAFFDALRRRGRAHDRLEYVASHSRLYSAMRTTYREFVAGERPTGPRLDAGVRRDQTRLYASEEKRAIVAGYHRRLEQLVSRARSAGVEVILLSLPANVREWRAEVSTGIAMLDDADRHAWSESLEAGRSRLETREFAAAAASLERAVSLAPGHSESWYLLARAFEGLARWGDARAAYARACDADASPIRRISGINDAIRQVARDRQVPLVDAEQVFERSSEHGLVGFNLIEDYAHPTREGHELIAWHLWDAIERAGWLGSEARASWELFEELIPRRRRRPVSSVNSAAWLYNQGVVLSHQGRREAAIRAYRQALALSPDYAGAMLNLGVLLREVGRNDDAVGVLERLVEIDPDNAEALSNLGNALLGLGRAEQAIVRYRAALRIRPDLARAHNNLGNALQSLERWEEAITQYEAAVRIEPETAEAHGNWGAALATLGRHREAVERLRIAVRIRPGYTEAQLRLGDALTADGQLADAAAAYETALRLEPEHPVALRRMAWFLSTCPLAELRDGARALELAGSFAARRGAGRFAFLDTLAAAHAESGQFEQALRRQREAVGLAPPELREALRRRLELYRRAEPYRDPM